MTSGSIVRDLRVSDVGSCGPGKAGFYYSKSWDGLDRTPTEPKDTPHPYTSQLVMHYDPWIKWIDNSNPNFVRECTALSAGWAATFTPQWSTNHYLKLCSKLQEKMSGSDFNLGVTIAESRQSWETIATAATRIRRGLNSLLRGDPHQKIEKSLGWVHSSRKIRRRKMTVRATARDLSSRWLEYSYAWVPLVVDTYNAGIALARIWGVPETFSARTSSFVASSNSNTDREYDVAEQMERFQIIATYARPAVTNILGLESPESVMWEKLPYSFVADWFIPIGSYLAAQNYFRNLSQAQFIETYYRTRYARGLRKIPGAKTLIDNHGGYWLTEVDVVRTISSQLVVPTPTFKSLDSVTSWKHCVSAVALLTNRFL